ncbi:hypothetical protein MTO96_036118 [Rhipicephalus appendiculatus]
MKTGLNNNCSPLTLTQYSPTMTRLCTLLLMRQQKNPQRSSHLLTVVQRHPPAYLLRPTPPTSTSDIPAAAAGDQEDTAAMEITEEALGNGTLPPPLSVAFLKDPPRKAVLANPRKKRNRKRRKPKTAPTSRGAAPSTSPSRGLHTRPRFAPSGNPGGRTHKSLSLFSSLSCRCCVIRRDVVLKNAQHFGANVKQAKTATHVKLEEVLLTWFREVTAAGVNVDGKCSAHPKDCNFTNVTVRFLPANTTSRLQPLDTGIIRNVKHHFKGLLVRRLLAKIDRKDENLRISLLDALHFLAMSWDNVTQDTIANCFRKCDFFAGQNAAPTEDQEPDADLHIEGWEDLGTRASAQDFVTADDNVATCGLRSVEELVNEAMGTESDTDGEDVDVCDVLPSASENHHDLNVLRRTVSAGSVSEETAARFNSFQAAFLRNSEGKKVQKNIMDFFSKK